MDDSLKQKLDARAQYQLSRGELKEPVEVLIRTDAPPTPEQQVELHAAGYTIRSAVGNVLSGTVAEPANLEELTRLAFVRKIEVSRSLYGQS